MTLTYPALAAARRILWLVTGPTSASRSPSCSPATPRSRPAGSRTTTMTSSPTRPRRGSAPQSTAERAGEFETILYGVAGDVATITLNRPESLNTIVPPMPERSRRRSSARSATPRSKVIVVRGAGRAFCAGYDFGGGFHHWDEGLTTDGEWDPRQGLRPPPTAPALAPTQKLMSIWRAPKPVIAQVHGWCVGGGSDFAALRRPRDRQRGRADRHALLADVGRLPARACGSTGSASRRQGARADRQAALRRRGGGGRADQRAVPFERLEEEVAKAAPASWPRSRPRSWRR